jgi:hypothetical protein
MQRYTKKGTLIPEKYNFCPTLNERDIRMHFYIKKGVYPNVEKARQLYNEYIKWMKNN